MGKRSVPSGAPALVVGLWGEAVPVTGAQGRVIRSWEEKEEHRRELARDREKERWAAGNPMIKMVGMGPEGKTCKSCANLRCHVWDKRYYKCALRGTPTHGPGTDQRVKWPACACYAPRGE